MHASVGVKYVYWVTDRRAAMACAALICLGPSYLKPLIKTGHRQNNSLPQQYIYRACKLT